MNNRQVFKRSFKLRARKELRRIRLKAIFDEAFRKAILKPMPERLIHIIKPSQAYLPRTNGAVFRFKRYKE